MKQKILLIVFLAFLIMLLKYFSEDIIVLSREIIKSETFKSLFEGVLSNAVYGIIIIILLALRKKIYNLFLIYILKGKTISTEKERIQFEKIYLQNFIERIKNDLPWEVDKYSELEISSNEININAKKVKPRLWHFSDSDESYEDFSIKNSINLQNYLKTIKKAFDAKR